MKRMRLHDGEEGSALLELALVMPVFLLVIFGILQSSFALFAYCNISYASRAAVRYASLHSSSSISPATSTSVRTIINPFVWCAPASDVSVMTTWSPSNSVGSTVQVQVQINLPLAIPFSDIQGFTVHSVAQRLIVR
jgi:Flp pilus assembly protein TadG